MNMKRDWDLIRKILLQLETYEPGQVMRPDEIDSERAIEIGYQFKLMVEAGLVDGTKECNDYKNLELCFIYGLKWEGHEFLDSVRKDSNWNKVKQIAKDKGAMLSFEAIKVIITQIIKNMF